MIPGTAQNRYVQLSYIHRSFEKLTKHDPIRQIKFDARFFFQYCPISFMLGRPLARSGRLIPIDSGQKLDLWSSTLEYTHCSARSLLICMPSHWTTYSHMSRARPR